MACSTSIRTIAGLCAPLRLASAPAADNRNRVAVRAAAEAEASAESALAVAQEDLVLADIRGNHVRVSVLVHVGHRNVLGDPVPAEVDRIQVAVAR